jgi:hypothetical protein
MKTILESVLVGAGIITLLVCSTVIGLAIHGNSTMEDREVARTTAVMTCQTGKLYVTEQTLNGPDGTRDVITIVCDRGVHHEQRNSVPTLQVPNNFFVRSAGNDL